MSKDNSPTPLSVMLGEGEIFDVNGKSYRVKPIELQDIEKFMGDSLSVGTQLFNISDKKSREKVDRWLGGKRDKDGNNVEDGYCFDEEGNPVTLEIAMANRWNVIDLKEFFKKLCDFSG